MHPFFMPKSNVRSTATSAFELEPTCSVSDGAHRTTSASWPSRPPAAAPRLLQRGVQAGASHKQHEPHVLLVDAEAEGVAGGADEVELVSNVRGFDGAPRGARLCGRDLTVYPLQLHAGQPASTRLAGHAHALGCVRVGPSLLACSVAASGTLKGHPTADAPFTWSATTTCGRSFLQRQALLA
jgi:hypothetical protein